MAKPKTDPAADPTNITELVTAAIDAEPEVPVHEVEPEPDEGDDAVELVRTGWVRLRSGGTTVRLRRPFFGELKNLRLLLEEVGDAIAERAEAAQVIAAEILRGATEEVEGETDAEAVARRGALTRRSKVAGRELTAFAEEQRIGWWRAVVETLGVQAVLPEDDLLPTWIVDQQLPAKVMQHWRSVPLGRG